MKCVDNSKVSVKQTFESFFKDSKAQVSFEYLLTVTFAILLVVVVTLFALNLRTIATKSSSRMDGYKEEFLKQIFG